MAGKKQAKLASDTKKVKKLLGEKILYVGLGKKIVNTCANCNSETSRGMISRYLDGMYCSETCVRKVANVES